MANVNKIQTNTQSKEKEKLTRTQIDDKIRTSLNETGDFIWSEQDANTIWSALDFGGNILTIGYGSSANNYIKDNNSQAFKDEILELVQTYEKSVLKDESEYFDDKNFNIIDIIVKKRETVEALLKHENIRYLEPSDYSYSNVLPESSTRSFKFLTAGCGFSYGSVKREDANRVNPGAIIPWAFVAHNIPKAWTISTGKDVTIAIIDTGISPRQKLLNSNFNNGHSKGRTVQKYGTYVDSWWWWSNNYDGVDDKCGHGTNMSSLATAPRNDVGLAVGVAYNANLVSYRAVKDVIINDYHEKRGIAEALYAIGNRRDIKIVSMSLGSPFSIGRVSDAIKYAYDRGKLIFAAGGTSTRYTTWYGVIFPATMNETVAVTGVKEGKYVNCDVCHSGSKIAFTIQMERSNSTKNNIPALSYYNGYNNYVGGSSSATATTAGIAALVWSKYPNWNRNQVLNKMKKASEFYPNKNSKYGYGNIDAFKAVN